MMIKKPEKGTDWELLNKMLTCLSFFNSCQPIALCSTKQARVSRWVSQLWANRNWKIIIFPYMYILWHFCSVVRHGIFPKVTVHAVAQKRSGNTGSNVNAWRRQNIQFCLFVLSASFFLFFIFLPENGDSLSCGIYC